MLHHQNKPEISPLTNLIVCYLVIILFYIFIVLSRFIKIV
jgi:hypothetical protein